MVQLPTTVEYEELRAFKEPDSLTIFAPYISPESASENPNRIALKNLLKEAASALAHHNVEPPVIAATLKPAHELVDNHEFWRTTHESLALFMHPTFFKMYRLPQEGIPTVISIRKGFNLAALNEVINDNKTYYVLALSHNDVQLFEGDRFEIKQIQQANLPTNMNAELRIDENPYDTQSHSISPAAGGRPAEAFHGHYNKSQVDKQLLEKFFRRIDKQLHAFLRDKKEPLVLAGVGYLLPIYNKINTYPHLLKEHIAGNLERVDMNWTREKAWSIVS